MNETVLHIRRVTSWDKLFIVTSLEYEPDVYRPYVFRTFNAWKASICKVAAERNLAVRVQWEETGQYDKTLLSVAPEGAEATP